MLFGKLVGAAKIEPRDRIKLQMFMEVAYEEHVSRFNKGLALEKQAAREVDSAAGAGSHGGKVPEKAQVKAIEGSLDLIIDTISATHDVDMLLNMVRCDGGNVCMVGLPPDGVKVSAFNFVGPRKLLTGSNIGGIAETQEMLDFCGRHNILCEVEKIAPAYINEAYERTVKSDVKYRFVIDTTAM